MHHQHQPGVDPGCPSSLQGQAPVPFSAPPLTSSPNSSPDFRAPQGPGADPLVPAQMQVRISHAANHTWCRPLWSRAVQRNNTSVSLSWFRMDSLSNITFALGQTCACIRTAQPGRPLKQVRRLSLLLARSCITFVRPCQASTLARLGCSVQRMRVKHLLVGQPLYLKCR